MKDKIIVIYKSKTGFTEMYARLVAEKLKCDALDIRKATKEKLAEYDTCIFGTRAHAGMIDGYKKAIRLIRDGGAPKMVLFVTGATQNSDEETVEDFWRQNLTPAELESIPHFYMQSGLCYEKMGLSDRLMMKMAARIMKNKKNKSQSDIELEQAISSSYDISSPEYIEPLVSYLNR